jgi:hypothetical protein
MGLQATYKTGLTLEDVQTKAQESGKFKVAWSTDDRKLMLYPHHLRYVRIQVMGQGIAKVWTPDLDQLHKVEDLLNESFAGSENPKPFRRAEKVREMGSRPAYYETPEEVVERLASDPDVKRVLELDRQLSTYEPGSFEKAQVLGLHFASEARLLGPLTLYAFRDAAQARTLEEALEILMTATAPIFDDKVSYWHWLLMEHKDVTPQAWSIACNILADLLNRDIAT